MSHRRQRHLAWLFTLVLILELALLCCACVHLSAHDRPGHERCAICAYARSALRRVCIVAAILTALLTAPALRPGARPLRRFIIADSPVLRRVRIND